MPEYRAVVFIHTLTSRGRRFRREGWTVEKGGLYATGDEMNEAIADTLRNWPERAMVLDEKVSLGESDSHGDTRVRGHWHEVLHGVRVYLTVEAPTFPPPEAWKPWQVKSFTEEP